MKGIMKKLPLVLLLLIYIALCPRLRAQTAVVEAKIATAEIFIGEQTEIMLSATSDTAQRVRMPQLTAGMLLTEGVEVLKVGRDSVVQNPDNAARKQTFRTITITSFDSALYRIPPFIIEVDGREYETSSLPLKVETVDIDTLHLDQFFGPREIAEPPFHWSDWRGLFFKAIALCLLLCLLLYLYIQQAAKRRLLPRLRLRPTPPPHVWAKTEIDKLNTQTDLRADAKKYYTKLTDILRSYLQKRYGFDATQMTSGQIVENLRIRLQGGEAGEVTAELREILSVADLAKFAKLQTRMDEDSANLLRALQIVDVTRPTDEELSKPKPTPPAPEVIRSSRVRKGLQLSMIVIGLVCLALLILCLRSLYLLLRY